MKHIFNIFIIFFLAFALGCAKSDTGNVTNVAGNGGTTGTGGSLARYTIVGNYLYTVDNEKLKVFSIADAANPILKNTINVGFEIETIYPFGNRLFIGSTSVIHIFNIDNPEQPVKLSTAISPSVMRRCDPVVAKDSVAYATLRVNGPCGGAQSILATYDIRNITNPVQVSQSNVTEPYGLGYQDSTLYVCDKRGLNVYNINNILQPIPVRNINNTQWFIDVIPNGNTLICWVNDGVIVYDITNRRNPVLIRKII